MKHTTLSALTLAASLLLATGVQATTTQDRHR